MDDTIGWSSTTDQKRQRCRIQFSRDHSQGLTRVRFENDEVLTHHQSQTGDGAVVVELRIDIIDDFTELQAVFGDVSLHGQAQTEAQSHFRSASILRRRSTDCI